MRGRRTEIDHLNGYVAQHGRRLGVKTPFNDAIVEIFHRHGVGFTPRLAHLDPLVAMVP